MEHRYSCYCLVVLGGFLCCCVIASDWPEGYYGLPMAKTGCPNGTTFDWKHGWIYQDTENYNPWNSKSTSFHLDGEVLPSSVNRSFCMKTQITNDHQRPLWPAGTYCIHQRTNNCPLGFKSGSINWDDEDDNNKNKESGTLPKVDLHTHSQTKIYFCCRNDGYKTMPIEFPSGSPFYLFAHKSMSCQQVKGAVSSREWIDYDTEDAVNNHDYVTAPAPYVKTDGQGIKIHYCYYTSCQYRLNASHGMITFPAFGNYANGQLCSWSITVQASQTIQVHFSRFRLSDIYDQLIFYDGKDESARRLNTLHGGYTQSEVTSRVVIQSSSSNLFVVFQSNHVNTDSGFQASYTAIGTPLTFPPPISTTEVATANPTTTIEATTTEATTTEATTTEATTTEATTTKARETTSLETTTATEAQVVSEKTNPTEIALSSSNPPSKPFSEPSSLPKGNSSKNYDTLKKTCIQQSQSTLTAVAIIIPLICIIAVIVMAVYLFFRLRTFPKKPSEVSVRYTSSPTAESVNNPAYVPSDAVIEASPPSTNNAYEDSKGDIYHEIQPSRQATDNPLYQSTDEEKHVYASFA